MAGSAPRELAKVGPADWAEIGKQVPKWQNECDVIMTRWYTDFLDSRILDLLEDTEGALRGLLRSIEMASTGQEGPTQEVPGYCSNYLLTCAANLLEAIGKEVH
jgi:hypothetical protein